MIVRVASLGPSAAISLGACSAVRLSFRLPRHNLPAEGASVIATGGRIASDGH